MLKDLFQAARGRMRQGVLVLLYHRVAELRRDPWSLCVSPAQFAQQLAVLRERTCPIPLAEIGAHLGTGLFQKPRVAVTFDDGYSDNLHRAEPLLRAFGIPATVFVVSGAVREGREFWWDELERIVFEPDRRVHMLQLRHPDRVLTWTAPNDGDFERDDRHDGTGEVLTTAQHVYMELYRLLFPLMPDERKAVMDDFIDQTGLTSWARPTHRPMSCAELVELAGSSVIHIGAHTVTHTVLAGMPVARQAEEVLQAKAELEFLTGTRLLLFSYPYGKREHYDLHTISILRNALFEYAFVNEPGIATASSDHLQIPRVVVPALDGPDFGRWLAHCLAALP